MEGEGWLNFTKKDKTETTSSFGLATGHTLLLSCQMTSEACFSYGDA